MIVIHQPYFLPWLGYFAKLMFADKFLILDDVKFSKRHNLDRCAIVGMNSEPIFLNIPCGQNMDKKINEIVIADNKFIDKIITTINYSYKTSKLFTDSYESIQNIIKNCCNDGMILSKININIIKNICVLLGINTSFHFSSEEKNCFENPTERILYFCKKLNDNNILVGDGKSLDVHDMEKLRLNGIVVYRQNFYTEHPTYFQCRRQKAEFLKAMSIVDALLNIGIEDTCKLLRHVLPYQVEV